MDVKEELIEQVKKYPFLYDKTCREQRHKNARDKAWEEIGRILEISGDECRELWFKLRNAYTNALKRRRLKPLVKWKYETQMEFLVPNHEQRTTHENAELTTGEESASEEKKDPIQEDTVCIVLPAPHEEKVSSYPSFSLSTSSPRRLHVPGVPRSTRKNKRIETSTNKMVAIMNENSRIRAQTSSNNEMDMFFLSLSKTVQRLSPEEQVQVKMEVGNVVFQAELKELKELKKQSQPNPPHLRVTHNSSLDSSTPVSVHSTSSSKQIPPPPHSAPSFSSSPHETTPPSAQN